jgi:alkylation response protein AidB-like acyl-CoA dehydrogenase
MDPFTPAQLDDRISQLLAHTPPDRSSDNAFLGAQFDAGLAWVWFPPGLGGLGLGREHQERINQRLAEAGAPSTAVRNPIGYGMGAPTVLVHGTSDQRQRYLRPLFTCEEIWCQLFSEPGAGSDVAGLATMATRHGDDWVVNGQKVWTTVAHTARWGMLLARTDPSVPKHQGMTYFIVDMHAPGVEVRPLRQMTGDAEFNEVFFTDAHIPDSQRLDAVGTGWKVAMTTLMNERVSISSFWTVPRNSGPIGEAMRIWNDSTDRNPVQRHRLAALWVQAEVLRLTNLRARALVGKGVPGPEGSLTKLMAAELNKQIYNACIDFLGMSGTLYPAGLDMGDTDPAASSGEQVHHAFLRSRANTIEGGTSEILRNIIGERILGLPGDLRVDKDVAWSEVPRS